MHDQGNADSYVIPPAESANKVRPEYLQVATAAVNSIRKGDVDVVREARQDEPESPYMVAEVAAALGVSKSTVYKAVESGELAALRFGNTRKGTIRIPHGAFVDYVIACMQAAVTRPGPKRRSRVIDIRDMTPYAAAEAS